VIKSFRDLEIYREAIDLSIEIEALIRSFPKHEQYLLVDQMRRSSRGIAPLIAEGYAKRSMIKTFRKYLRDAIGEANEMMSHLEVADRLGYIKKNGYGQELIERYDILGKKIHNLKDNWQNFK
jgi:four helix bundle protein